MLLHKRPCPTILCPVCQRARLRAHRGTSSPTVELLYAWACMSTLGALAFYLVTL